MKSDNDDSSFMFLFSNLDDTNNKDKIEPNLDQSNFSKDKKINNNSVNNNNENSNSSINQGDQLEFNNFNISFFLPKDLQENIEKEGVFQEKIYNQEEKCNPAQINDTKTNNQIDNNNDLDSNNNEFMNKGNSKIMIPNINNNDYINQLNDNQLQKMNNNFNMKANKINEFNNKNNSISNGYNNFTVPNNYYIINNELNQSQNIPLINQNIPSSSFQNINNIYGNQFQNSQLFLNNCNFLSPINQINLNFNHFHPQPNDLAYYYSQNKFNNNNNNIGETESKKRKKKIIDDYTIEMFGRRGWICELCNNFNYETRKKCNRCHINKKPKKINNYLLSERNKNINHKNDWHCSNCGNFNYSFRVICNRCQKKKSE